MSITFNMLTISLLTILLLFQSKKQVKEKLSFPSQSRIQEVDFVT